MVKFNSDDSMRDYLYCNLHYKMFKYAILFHKIILRKLFYNSTIDNVICK